jgi:hypothetical protein
VLVLDFPVVVVVVAFWTWRQPYCCQNRTFVVLILN